MNSFLFELGTEEIPAGMIEPALQQLCRGFEKVLADGGVTGASTVGYSSPRRLAVFIDRLPDRQPDREELVTGPPASVALDQTGAPTQAAEGFARKMGVSAFDLEVIHTEKGDYLARRRTLAGKPVNELLVEELPTLVSSLLWPKSMYWRESGFRFIRPLRWFLVLWNTEVQPFELEGVRAGRTSRGHRFLGRSEVRIESPEKYKESLRSNFVLVDFEERKEKIKKELETNLPDGCRLFPDPALLDMVAYLNEYPTVLRGSFSRNFLRIPQEVLITVMRHHQKYFAVVDAESRIEPWFLTVINTTGDAEGTIRKGHERVLKARLEDGAFFWENDQRQKLEDRTRALDQVVFQKELGTYLDKTRRIRAICRAFEADADLEKAAWLCKADLNTEMVFEMPELQGVMGGLYARQEGYPESVWKAIYDHYLPQSMEGELPSTRNGAMLSVADKLDTIVGCFGVGIVPTGSRDPFALRRLGQGLIRVLLEHRMDYPLRWLVETAVRQHGSNVSRESVLAEVMEFLQRRLHYILREKGMAYDTINALAASGVDGVHSALQRALALEKIRNEPDFEALAVAFKRVRNILANQSIEPGVVQEGRLVEEAERLLYQEFQTLKPKVGECLESSDFFLALRLIASLRRPVDLFFDEVLVMEEDTVLRRNRLLLLQEISELFLRIADISEIVTPAEN